jgi:hypothetical protein
MSSKVRFKVHVSTPGGVTVYGFARLPIAIGRHADNDLRLEERFVSSYHARLTEVSGRLCIVDLASTNGISVATAGGGRTRIVSQAPYDLAAHGFEFFLGACRISVDLSFEGLLPSLPAFSSLDSPLARGIGGASFGKSSLPESIRSSEPGEARARALQTRELELEPERVAFQCLRELAFSFVPGLSLETTGDVARLVTRLHSSIELLCRCFVQLQAGHVGFLSGLGVRAPERRTVDSEHRLDTVEHPRQVAEMLLDWRASADDPGGALEARLVDVAVHQVAVLDGVMQGVQALLKELAPERVEAEAARRRPRSLLGRPGRHRACWQRYQQRHAELCQRDSALKHVFGEAFAEAYAAYCQKVTTARPGR